MTLTEREGPPPRKRTRCAARLRGPGERAATTRRALGPAVRPGQVDPRATNAGQPVVRGGKRADLVELLAHRLVILIVRFRTIRMEFLRIAINRFLQLAFAALAASCGPSFRDPPPFFFLKGGAAFPEVWGGSHCVALPKCTTSASVAKVS